MSFLVSVHPRGQFISHSRNDGLSLDAFAKDCTPSLKCLSARRKEWQSRGSNPFSYISFAHVTAWFSSLLFSPCNREAPCPPTLGVPQDVDPFTVVWGPHLSRREHLSLDAVAQVTKVADDFLEPRDEQVSDVLAEDEKRLDHSDDVPNARPKPARIVLAQPMACDADGLAGEAGSEAANLSAPRPWVEGEQVSPDRSVGQDSLAHTLDQDRAVNCLSLNPTDDARAWHSKPESEFESACT